MQLVRKVQFFKRIIVNKREQIRLDVQGALECNVTRSVITTIRATVGLWSVSYLIVHLAATSADVMLIIQAATVSSPSIKRVLRRGGDHRFVVLATVRRIVALIPVVTSRLESAAAGYVL